jgi:hypothetical protein
LRKTANNQTTPKATKTTQKTSKPNNPPKQNKQATWKVIGGPV